MDAKEKGKRENHGEDRLDYKVGTAKNEVDQNQVEDFEVTRLEMYMFYLFIIIDNE